MQITAPLIQIIVGSTRDERRGEPIARWPADLAAARGDLTVELVDLGRLRLPFLTHATPPMNAHARDGAALEWSRQVAAADGYLVVTPEYNHGYPAPLKNALDHLFSEWNRKPMAFVSDGASGGEGTGRRPLCLGEREPTARLVSCPLRTTRGSARRPRSDARTPSERLGAVRRDERVSSNPGARPRRGEAPAPASNRHRAVSRESVGLQLVGSSNARCCGSIRSASRWLRNSSRSRWLPTPPPT